jgi:hypothetical protein
MRTTKLKLLKTLAIQLDAPGVLTVAPDFFLFIRGILEAVSSPYFFLVEHVVQIIN